MQINDLLRQATQQLSGSTDSARLDAELLLAHCLNKPRSYLFTWPEVEPDETQLRCFESLLAQRKSGQPIAYLLGYREFRDLKLKVTADTLIPRPETELLVETALELLTETPCPQILELGTGSGAIAIALAKEIPSARIISCDISSAALRVAQSNAGQYQLSNIRFLQSDWFSNIPTDKPFDLVISNPPYIEDNDPHLKQGDVRFEPVGALASGQDGLDDIRHLITHSVQFLKQGGTLMFEHGYDQGGKTIGLMQQAEYTSTRCIKDLAGHDRITLGYTQL
uniref:Release factor glutamine methyltransferase n=1 Tax=uncultured Thiotrichaceae bacterium TaxID=298394 RepID=A0A6S6UAZ4_9GAMM|nr:MAG: Protein-N(5)-glutamine methyltransferase PrmC, methylates polypeptide chain release factors RF1 and RF2 [uncultured Thiotrichaceae bacterium]